MLFYRRGRKVVQRLVLALVVCLSAAVWLLGASHWAPVGLFTICLLLLDLVSSLDSDLIATRQAHDASEKKLAEILGRIALAKQQAGVGGRILTIDQSKSPGRLIL